MSRARNVSIGINVVLILLLVLSGLWFQFIYRKQRSDMGKKLAEISQELQAFKTDPNQASKAEANRIVAEVGKLYALPKDEEPSVATVKDKDKLKDQPFFANAQNNDVTIIYSKAKIAILYRPSTKQIINVSSVSIQDQATPAPTATPNP